MSKLSISLCCNAVSIIYPGKVVAFPFKTTSEVAHTRRGKRKMKIVESQSLQVNKTLWSLGERGLEF